MNENSGTRRSNPSVWRVPLSTKIIAWSFVPTAIILLAVALVTFFAFQNTTEQLVLERDLDVTYVSANQLAANLREYEDVLNSVARNSDIYLGDPPTQREALKQAGNRLAVFDAGVLLLDEFGKIMAAEPDRVDLVGTDWSSRTFYQDVVRSQIARTTPGLVLSDIVSGGPGGTDVIIMALPILGERNEFHGILAGLFRVASTATHTFYGDIITLRIGESGSTYLVDSTGRVIYHSDVDRIGEGFQSQRVVQRVLNNEVDAIRTRDLEGNDIVAGFAPVPGTPWGLVAEETWATLTSGFRGYRNFLLLLIVLGVVMPIIVVGFGVRRITKPITDLIGAAQEVARGNFGQKIGAQSGDELEELAEQFNFMAEQLQESYANLERRVAVRTRELATLNAIAGAVSRSLDLDEILSDALEETLALLDMEAGAILLLDREKEVLSTRVQHGLSKDFLQAVSQVRLGEGISSQAMAQGKPVVLNVEDYARGDSTEHLAPSVMKEGVQTLVSTPLLQKGQALGVLNLITRQSRSFPPQELALLTAIGQQIGVAVENAGLYEQTQQELSERIRTEEELRRVSDERARRNRELVLLNRVIAATTSRLESTAVLEAVCRELALAFSLPEVGAALLNEAGTTLTVVAEHLSDERPSALGTVLPVRGYPSAEYVLEHKAPLAIADAQQDPLMAPVHDLMRQRDTASLLILPLSVRGEVVGTIGMVAVERTVFTEEEIDLAASAAAAASQALERARSEEELRRSQQRLSAHVQHTPLAYIEWDADLKVVDWNPSAERIFGYSQAEAENHHAYEIIVPPEVQPHVTEVWQSLLRQTGGTRSTNENVTKDGRGIICEWYNTPLIDHDGQVVGLASLVQDITERVQSEEDLREAKEAAENANRAKSIFLANMSHELRTPLNAILGFAQLMNRDPEATTEQRENLEIIGRSGEHLLGLINDVLQMSKIEAGRTPLQITNFDLYRMLDGLEEMFGLRAREKGLMLFFDRSQDVPQYVRADEGKLRQVLMNLLGNAIKFTSEGGVSLRVAHFPAELTAGWEQDQNGLRLLFEVEDSGPGIASEEMVALFDPFVQTSAGHTYASQEGTGLGLPISRRFVRLMGGDFMVNSEPDKGSIFSFHVPMGLADASDEQTYRTTRRTVGLAPDQPFYRLLVAENEGANRKLLVDLLTRLGMPYPGAEGGSRFQVLEALNGQEALEMWAQWQPHLIWMDLRMPVMDGYEATRRIKATAQGQATIIVALTASAFEEDRAKILEQGCDDFVRKPYREEEISDTLAKHLGVRFVYEDEEAQPMALGARPEDALTPAALAALPDDLVTELHRAATELDADVILDLLKPIREQNAPLADALVRLVDNYRFDTIMSYTASREVGYEQQAN